jgi:tetratricopeptide (TPR) repeat protein
MLTMWAYARYAKKPGLPGYLPVLLFFTLGLLAKPMLVTLPLVLLLLDYWPLGRLKCNEPKQEVALPAQPKQEKKRKRRTPQPQEQKKQPLSKDVSSWSRILPLVYEKIPLLALSAALSFITFYAQQKGGAVAVLTKVPLADRLSNAVVTYAAYLWKMLWPSNLAVFYPMEAWSASIVLASAALLLALTFAALRWSGHYPYLLVGWLWYLVTLLPVIGIIKVGEAAMADRYTYISLIGPFVAVSWGTRDLSTRWIHRKELGVGAVGLLVVAALSILTSMQAKHWKSSGSLYRHAIAVTENNYTAHTNLSAVLIDEGRQDEALTHLEIALKLKPDFSFALYNLGIIRMNQGEKDEAMRYLQSAIRSNPNLSEALRCLAFLQLERGEATEAIQNFERTLAGRGPDPQVYAGLADALVTTGRYEEALFNYGRALALKPDAADVHYNAARIFIAMGRLEEAIGHLRVAIRVKPDYARAHNNLGSALLLQKKIDEAIQHFQEALHIDPDYQIARANLKDALIQKKKTGNRETMIR